MKNLEHRIIKNESGEVTGVNPLPTREYLYELDRRINDLEQSRKLQEAIKLIDELLYRYNDLNDYIEPTPYDIAFKVIKENLNG